jgi:hypothetical protein
VLGIVTTAAAAIGAWFQGGRHQQLALNYQATAAKLELLLAQYRASPTVSKQLVLDAEAVFQAEHAAWLAEWQTPAAAPATYVAASPVTVGGPPLGAREDS